MVEISLQMPEWMAITFEAAIWLWFLLKAYEVCLKRKIYNLTKDNTNDET